MKLQIPLLTLLAVICMSSCKKDTTKGDVKINFIFKFDSTQARLNGLGQPASIAAGRAGQSPRFNTMSAHYLELAPSANTLLGAGQVLYRAPETSIGGANAIDFSKSNFAGDGKVFLSVPLASFAAGSYSWLRVSLAYQNYNVFMTASGQKIDVAIASFIGYNTYLSTYKVKDSTQNINGNKLQGYWAVEGAVSGLGFVRSGQAPPGATTVPNPLFATSPVPAGSCVVTGQFASPLVITGTETTDITVIVSLSTNKSFEWIDTNGNGLYEPLLGEQVVDMGIRGMVPSKL